MGTPLETKVAFTIDAADASKQIKGVGDKLAQLQLSANVVHAASTRARLASTSRAIQPIPRASFVEFKRGGIEFGNMFQVGASGIQLERRGVMGAIGVAANRAIIAFAAIKAAEGAGNLIADGIQAMQSAQRTHMTIAQAAQRASNVVASGVLGTTFAVIRGPAGAIARIFTGETSEEITRRMDMGARNIEERFDPSARIARHLHATEKLDTGGVYDRAVYDRNSATLSNIAMPARLRAWAIRELEAANSATKQREARRLIRESDLGMSDAGDGRGA